MCRGGSFCDGSAVLCSVPGVVLREWPVLLGTGCCNQSVPCGQLVFVAGVSMICCVEGLRCLVAWCLLFRLSIHLCIT